MQKDIFTSDYIKKQLASSPKWVERAVVAVYNLQTDIEKNNSCTITHNGKGFNAFDADTLSVLAEKIIKSKKESGTILIKKDLIVARIKIMKYSGQLAKIAQNTI